ncbi:ORFL283W, partial [Human betaherpesvirus 5]
GGHTANNIYAVKDRFSSSIFTSTHRGVIVAPKPFGVAGWKSL